MKSSKGGGKNCWEIKKCGREPGGPAASELGVCPAALPNRHAGVNNGTYAGRYCWRMPGASCAGELQGSWGDKIAGCAACEVYALVRREEKEFFRP